MLFNRKKETLNETNQQARKFWENKKDSLRWKVALFFVVLNIVGLEFSAPGNSITTTISSEILNNSSFLPEIIQKINVINQHFGFVDINFVKVAGKSTKILIILIMALICYYFIRNKDPFSNLELLRNIPISGYNRKHFYLKEIAFYAKYIPSNVLAVMCNNCPDGNECTRSIPLLGEEKTRSWCRLFAKLSAPDVISWHKATYECRKAFYLKYGLLFSILFLLIAFVTVAILNKVFLPVPMNQIYLGAYLLLLTSSFIFISFTHGLREGQGGAWRSFREYSKLFFKSIEFDDFIKNNLCCQITSEKEIKSIMTMTNYLSYLVENRLIKHICVEKERTLYNKSNIRRILQHLKACFYVTNNKEVNFRCALFLLSENHKYLYPFVRDDSDHSIYYCLNDKSKVHDISSDFFKINGNSVVAESWRTKKPLSRNINIQTVCPVSSDHLKSIFCFPLTFHEDVYQNLKEKRGDLPINFGVLCVDSDGKSIFSQKNNNLNTIIIKSFADRIVYELSIGIFYKNKE
ncbi:MAG: hypothetical protein U9P73_08625 [Candidatus Cloacimonadota bacterium]|nr:hypothetical protein [Candidatus Cloacimonadota bacterium]